MGGLSPERNVSLCSGTLISKALANRGHRVLPIDLYLGIQTDADVDSLFSTEPITEDICVGDKPNLEELSRSCGGRVEEIGPRVIEACRAADCTFLALHGAIGENGQLQAMLDIYHIPYTGSGYIGSMLAMDKDIAKKLLRADGILTPDWLRIDTKSIPPISQIVDAVGLPAVVKPCSCGSSVGVYIANTQSELESAIISAASYERYIMVEQKISGRELTCAFFDGAPLPPVEIIPKMGFYDYQNKYSAGATEEICPAPIGKEATDLVYEATRRGFAALRLRSYARFDYILDSDGRAWCLEANTLPGMTSTSLLPQEAAAVGMTYEELCEKIALTAIPRDC